MRAGWAGWTAAGVAVAATAHAGPALTARGRWRQRALPGLCGVGRPGGVALTFDDGPDRRGTEAVLRVLAGLGWSATFFLLGEQVERRPELARRLVEAGHEVALHGHAHRNHLARTPAALRRDLGRSCAAVTAAAGVRPTSYRPPYGVLTGGTLAACRDLGLRPVLWTAWGRDWSGAGPQAVARTVLDGLADGGCVLLHDSDVTSAPGSWRATAASLPLLAAGLGLRGWEVRRLDDHLRPEQVAA